MLSNETVKANSRKLNSLPEYAYNYVSSVQSRIVNNRLSTGELYSSDMHSETLAQALRSIENLKIGAEVCFYPKGEKHGKKVTGTIIEMTSKGVSVKFEGNVYNTNCIYS